MTSNIAGCQEAGPQLYMSTYTEAYVNLCRLSRVPKLHMNTVVKNCCTLLDGHTC